MGFWDWLRRPAVEAAAPRPLPGPGAAGPTPPAATGDFKRPSTNLQVDSLASWGGLAIAAAGLLGVEDPRTIPWWLLDLMGYSPAVYLGEYTVAAPLRDPALYVVEHDDPAILAETLGWVEPLMPGLLRTCTRALAYGCAPFVLDWRVEDLVVTLNERKRTFFSHQHYGPMVHEIHPGEAFLEVVDDRLQWLAYYGRRYGPDRAYVYVADGMWGSWLGNGSRRRAWAAWYKRQNVDRWEGQYLERSVDAPRIGRVPKGPIKVGGIDVQASEYMAESLAVLKGSGVMILPSDTDPSGKMPLWDVNLLQQQLVEEVWHTALSRCDAQMILAALAPPTLVSGSAQGGDTRSLEMLFQEAVEGLADAIAAFVQDVIATAHRVMHGTKVKPPVVWAREIPKAKLQRLLEVFKVAALQERQAGEGKVVTLAELLPDAFLEELLGTKLRPLAEAKRDVAAAPTGAQPSGRPIDSTGGREDRRDRATTPEGADGTGAPEDRPNA